MFLVLTGALEIIFFIFKHSHCILIVSIVIHPTAVPERGFCPLGRIGPQYHLLYRKRRQKGAKKQKA